MKRANPEKDSRSQNKGSNMNFKVKVSATVAALALATLAALGNGAAAHADDIAPVTPPTRFTPYEVHQDWFKAGGTPENAWPQSTTAITCGGIVQHDVYTVTSQKEKDDLAALIAGGVLNSSADDAEFHPHDYSVVQLPDCVVVPPKPADVVKTTTTHNLVCTKDDSFYYTTVNTETISFTYDEKTNTWIAGEPVTITDTTKVAANDEQCPPVVTPPVTTPPTPPVVTPPTHKPVPPVVVKPIPKPTANPVLIRTANDRSTAIPATTVTPNSLAYTGSAPVWPWAVGASALVLLGIALVAFRRGNRVLDNSSKVLDDEHYQE